MQSDIVRGLHGVGTAAAYDDLWLDPWPYDVTVEWTAACAIERTNIPTNIEILLRRGTQLFRLTSAVPALAGASVDWHGSVRLGGDYEIGARFIGATAGDPLELSIFGRVVEG